MFSSFIGALFCTSDMIMHGLLIICPSASRAQTTRIIARADLRIPSNVEVTVVTLTFMDFLAVPPVKHDD